MQGIAISWKSFQHFHPFNHYDSNLKKTTLDEVQHGAPSLGSMDGMDLKFDGQP